MPMKRSEIRLRPLSDTVLAGLEPDIKEYREQEGNGLYFRVKPDGQKSWLLRYKTPAGKRSWLALGGYPEISGAFARQKASVLRSDAADAKNPMETKQARRSAELAASNNTFEPLAREWHSSRLNSWDTGTAKRVLGALERPPCSPPSAIAHTQAFCSFQEKETGADWRNQRSLDRRVWQKKAKSQTSNTTSSIKAG